MTDPIPSYFHFNGGGFRLDSVSYTLNRIPAPVEPTRVAFGQKMRLSQEWPEMTDAQIAVEVEKRFQMAELLYPRNRAAWELVPYRVNVYVPGQPEPLVFGYATAERFLRAMGVLRRCDMCDQDRLIVDYEAGDTVAACIECQARGEAYRSVDAR